MNRAISLTSDPITQLTWRIALPASIGMFFNTMFNFVDTYCADLSTARRPNLEQKRVNVDLPIWMIESLDSEADRVGVTRQSIIKVWLAERLKIERPA